MFRICIILTFLFQGFGLVPVQAQELLLPQPGTMVHVSLPFSPVVLKGIKVHPEDPLRFDFLLSQGDSTSAEAKTETTKLIKYFLAALTTPEKDLWVNLSPYEKDRIIPEGFGQTEMGRDLLAQDYILKQLTASLIYPEGEIGKKFWKRIYEEAARKYGNVHIPVNTFNKVWVVPEKAVVYENAKIATAYVVESRLKVLTESDYLAMKQNVQVSGPAQINSQLARSVLQEIVIPELTKEVNQGKNFAQLRQVYDSFILAAWYKKKIKDSILSKAYVDHNKIAGVNIDDPQEKMKIYNRYLEAFKKGAYNYIKEDRDALTGQMIPRKYFSGGMRLSDDAMIITDHVLGGLPAIKKIMQIVAVRINALRGKTAEELSSEYIFTDLLGQDTIDQSNANDEILFRSAMGILKDNPEIINLIKDIKKEHGDVLSILRKAFIYHPSMLMVALSIYARQGNEEIRNILMRYLDSKGFVDIKRWADSNQVKIPELLSVIQKSSSVNADKGLRNFLIHLGLGDKRRVYAVAGVNKASIPEYDLKNIADDRGFTGIKVTFYDNRMNLMSPNQVELPRYPLKEDSQANVEINDIKRRFKLKEGQKVVMANSVPSEHIENLIKTYQHIYASVAEGAVPLFIIATEKKLRSEDVSQIRAAFPNLRIGVRNSISDGVVTAEDIEGRNQVASEFNIVLVNTRGEASEFCAVADLGILFPDRNLADFIKNGVSVLQFEGQVLNNREQLHFFMSKGSVQLINSKNLEAQWVDKLNKAEQLKLTARNSYSEFKADVVQSSHLWLSMFLLASIVQHNQHVDAAMTSRPTFVGKNDDAVSFARALGNRERQEDGEINLYMEGYGHFIGVIDGHKHTKPDGTVEYGTVIRDAIQNFFPTILRGALINANGDNRVAIKTAFEELAKKVADYDSGAAFSGVFIPNDDSNIILGNIGDAPIMIGLKNGRYMFANMHNIAFSTDIALAEFINQDGYLVYKDKNNRSWFSSLTRSVGDRVFKDTGLLESAPEIRVIKKDDVEFILVGSDGIHNPPGVGLKQKMDDIRLLRQTVASNRADLQTQLEQLGGLVRQGASVDEVIAYASRNAISGDNMTIGVWRNPDTNNKAMVGLSQFGDQNNYGSAIWYKFIPESPGSANKAVLIRYVKEFKILRDYLFKFVETNQKKLTIYSVGAGDGREPASIAAYLLWLQDDTATDRSDADIKLGRLLKEKNIDVEIVAVEKYQYRWMAEYFGLGKTKEFKKLYEGADDPVNMVNHYLPAIRSKQWIRMIDLDLNDEDNPLFKTDQHPGFTLAEADVIFSNEVLRHLEEKAVERMYAFVSQHLRPNGISLFSDNDFTHFAGASGSFDLNAVNWEASVHQFDLGRLKGVLYHWDHVGYFVNADAASISTGKPTGGIDLNANKDAFEVKHSTEGEIKLKSDAAMLHAIEMAPGLNLRIIDMKPMDNIKQFLGIS